MDMTIDKCEPKPGDVIAVWFSCGAASAIALKAAIEKYQECHVIALNNPVLEEGEDNQRFLRDVSRWLGIKIVPVINPKYPLCSAEEVWERRKFMSHRHGAPCTSELKIAARLNWQKSHHTDWIVMGFTVEEESRYYDMVERGVDNLLPILIDERITKGDCYRIISDAGIELPEGYRKGYPNANCRGCVKATSPTYWNLVRNVDPDVFKRRAEMSRRLGARLVRVNGERIFLDELSPDAVGRPLKNMDSECGIFCQD